MTGPSISPANPMPPMPEDNRRKHKWWLPVMEWSENLGSLRFFGFLAAVGCLILYAGLAISVEVPVSVTARFKFAKDDFKSFESALAMYKLSAGSFPTTLQGLEALVTKPVVEPVPRRWSQVMDKLHRDPWGSPYIYRFPGKKRSDEFEIGSKGPDGIIGTADDLSSQEP